MYPSDENTNAACCTPASMEADSGQSCCTVDDCCSESPGAADGQATMQCCAPDECCADDACCPPNG